MWDLATKKMTLNPFGTKVAEMHQWWSIQWREWTHVQWQWLKLWLILILRLKTCSVNQMLVMVTVKVEMKFYHFEITKHRVFIFRMWHLYKGLMSLGQNCPVNVLYLNKWSKQRQSFVLSCKNSFIKRSATWAHTASYLSQNAQVILCF